MNIRIIRPYPKADPTRLRIWCPGCNEHHDVRDGNNGWTYDGNEERPTLSPSVLFSGGGRCCHSFVRDGRIEFLSDCDHALKSSTVDLPTVDTWPEWARTIHE